MNRRPDHIIAYTLDGSQPVVSTYISDKPYFYSSMSEEDLAREIMRDTRDILIECRNILLSGAAC